jgi:hypothetical protein
VPPANPLAPCRLLSERNPQFPGQYHVLCTEHEEYHRQATHRALAVEFASLHLLTEHGRVIPAGRS